MFINSNNENIAMSLKSDIYNILKVGTVSEPEIWLKLEEKYTMDEIHGALVDLIEKIIPWRKRKGGVIG